MKKTTLLMTFALAATFAWAGNNTEYPTKAQANTATKEVKDAKQRNKQKQPAERNDVLSVINEINNLCNNLTTDIKTLEAAGSINDLVWEHRDSLDQLSTDTLELFLKNLISIDLKSYPLPNTPVPNTSTWKDIAPKELVNYVDAYYDSKDIMVKMADDFFEKKQHVLDTFFAEIEYGKTPVETAVEAVKKMLDAPETRALFGKQPLYLGLMKGARSVLKSMNSRSKILMQVTDKDLSEMFGSNQTENDGVHFLFEQHFPTTNK